MAKRPRRLDRRNAKALMELFGFQENAPTDPVSIQEGMPAPASTPVVGSVRDFLPPAQQAALDQYASTAPSLNQALLEMNTPLVSAPQIPMARDPNMPVQQMGPDPALIEQQRRLDLERQELDQLKQVLQAERARDEVDRFLARRRDPRLQPLPDMSLEAQEMRRQAGVEAREELADTMSDLERIGQVEAAERSRQELDRFLARSPDRRLQPLPDMSPEAQEIRRQVDEEKRAEFADTMSELERIGQIQDAERSRAELDRFLARRRDPRLKPLPDMSPEAQEIRRQVDEEKRAEFADTMSELDKLGRAEAGRRQLAETERFLARSKKRSRDRRLQPLPDMSPEAIERRIAEEKYRESLEKDERFDAERRAQAEAGQRQLAETERFLTTTPRASRGTPDPLPLPDMSLEAIERRRQTPQTQTPVSSSGAFVGGPAGSTGRLASPGGVIKSDSKADSKVDTQASDTGGTKMPGQLQMAGLLGLGELLRYGVSYFGPAQQYARRRVKQLEAAEKDNFRDRALEQEERQEGMAAIRGLGESTLREQEKAMAMQPRTSAGRLQQMREGAQRQLYQASLGLEKDIQARKMARAAQQQGQLESMYAYQQQNRDEALKRLMRGGEQVATQLGRISAAEAQLQKYDPTKWVQKFKDAGFSDKDAQKASLQISQMGVNQLNQAQSFLNQGGSASNYFKNVDSMMKKRNKASNDFNQVLGMGS